MESTIQKQPAVSGVSQAERIRPWRWAKGQSGNPRGLGHRSVKQIIEVLGAEFEVPTPVEQLLIEQAARLLLKAEKSGNADICVRAFSAVRRLLAHLRRQRIEDAPPPPRPPLPWNPTREQLGAPEADHD
jgi:hypothetical protein